MILISLQETGKILGKLGQHKSTPMRRQRAVARLIMYCRTAIAKIMVGMKGLLVRVDGWRNTKCWIGPPKKQGIQMDHYSWLVALLWRFELFTSSRRHHHQNRSTGDQGTPFYLSKWSNVRWHPINLVETSGFYTKKTLKNMDRTNRTASWQVGQL